MSPAVIEARSWIGTPYVHQASAKGAGCDCLGLIRGVWRALYGQEPAAVPQYSMDWDETQGAEVLLSAAQRHLRRCAGNDFAVGEVLLFRMRHDAVAKHLGILSAVGEVPKFIHAYMGHGVVESHFSTPWRRRVVARFAFHKG